AIVIVDELQKGLRTGIAHKHIVAETVKQLGIPLLASTLTTILSFMPIALLQGGTGEFVRTIAQTVILALVSSLILSLTIIPVLSLRLYQLTHRSHQTKTHWWDTGINLPLLTGLYRQILKLILYFPVLGLVIGLIIPITGFVVAGTL
ncbi:MAG: efflux RND transporter permease subunit, partial [Microcystis panniformis]